MRSLLSRLGALSAASLFSLPALNASIAVTAAVIGVRHLDALEELELSSFDQLVGLRPDEGPDNRLLVVKVTEEDIRNLGKWPTPDQTLAQLLEKLEQDKPRVIGLDIYRDLPLEPGHLELATLLQANQKIIAVCQPGNSADHGVAPPPTVPPSRLGFSDIVVDPGGMVRRSLLFLTPEPNSSCPANYSFGLQLALHYLEKEKIQPQLTSQHHLQLGSTIFTPIEKDTGGYQNIDALGYQVMLNYRSAVSIAQQVTLTDVLKGRIDPSLVKDRIVLIGVTAASGNDFFYTPYTRGQQDLRMPGVLVHAQMVSQILSAVLNNRPLIWTWPRWGEVLWVWGWSLVGGVLAWRIRHPLLLGVTGGVALGGLVGVCFAVLTQGGWVSLVPPALALVVTGASVVSYRSYLGSERPEKSGHPARSNTVNLISSGETNTTESSTANPDADSLIDRILVGRYKIIELIGSGGFGRTYLAADTQRPGSPHCVVKQLVPARKEENFWQIAKRLFNTEAESLEKLGRHEQIPQLLAYVEENQEFYLVQEFIKGHSLSEELPPGKRLGESQVVDLLRDVLGILDFIHSYGVIHRDIKPANIIRQERDGRLILIDFGAVKLLQTQIKDVEQLQTLSSQKQENFTIAIGTLVYAAPEQLMGQPVLNSDIYALGMIAIQAVTGLVPTQLRKDPITYEIRWRDYARVSGELAAILDKMVRHNSSERYQSAVEVLQALQHF